MKILTTILTSSQTQIRADACLETWIKDIKKPHSWFFYGDQEQSKCMDNTWNCSPDDGECRLRLPEKTYKMLKKSLQYEWDFLFKCDDDTYVNFNMLEENLKKYDPKECLYLGCTIGEINDSILSYITKKQIYTQELNQLFKKNNGKTSFFKDVLPAKLIEKHENIYKFRYAHGGAGYILTRNSVKKCLNSLQKFYKDKSINKVAEDYSVGLALQMEGIDLQHVNGIFTPHPSRAKEDQSICVKNIIEENKITTHYASRETIHEIDDKKNNLLICIYSSHADLPLANKLRNKIQASPKLKKQKNIIILSDDKQKNQFRYDEKKGILYVKVKECYTHLSLKTEAMIRACSKLFRFKFLVKWDAGTIDPDRCYAKIENAEFAKDFLIRHEFDNKHYSSFLHSSCNGEQSKGWFLEHKKEFLPILQKDGRNLASKKIIPEEVPYCRGKFYILSKEFCDFISQSKQCSKVFYQNFQCNFGAEDLSIGICFQKFKDKYDKFTNCLEKK